MRPNKPTYRCARLYKETHKILRLEAARRDISLIEMLDIAVRAEAEKANTQAA